MAFPMLMALGAGISVAGQVGSAIEAGKAGEKAMLESIRAGVFARFRARREAMDIREEGEDFLSRQKAAFAKSGVILDSGSPLLVQMETLRKIERDAIRMEQYGDEAMRQKKRESEMLFKQAQLKASGSFLGAMSTAITAYGAFKKLYKPPAPASNTTVLQGWSTGPLE